MKKSKVWMKPFYSAVDEIAVSCVYFQRTASWEAMLVFGLGDVGPENDIDGEDRISVAFPAALGVPWKNAGSLLGIVCDWL